jgi:hypothetical protein
MVLMKICSKARVVQGSLLLPTFARVCGKFCSETSPIAAAHGAGVFIFGTQPQLTLLEYQSSSNPMKTKQATPYSKHKNWKKNKHFFDVDIQ